MNDFNRFFEALQQSLLNDDFVKLTLSKPTRKGEGLVINVYLRLFLVDDKQIFELKYRYATEEIYKQFTLEDSILELEKLLTETFRLGTLFTLTKDLQVLISKKKLVSYRELAPSFKNKLPEIGLSS